MCEVVVVTPSHEPRPLLYPPFMSLSVGICPSVAITPAAIFFLCTVKISVKKEKKM
jgi:hypothetical protein